MLPASVFSSFASLRQFVLGLNRIFSPTEVVSLAGPGASLAERPNFDHDLRSATRGLTVSLIVVKRIRRVVFTFFPSSLRRQVTIVLVPSLFVVVVLGGSSTTASSSSSSSAQSRLRAELESVHGYVAETEGLL
jgi:hypothetical protein